MSRELQHKKYVRMTSEPVGRLVTSLAVPSIVSMLITGIYNLADTFFVGQINTQSVAALDDYGAAGDGEARNFRLG